MKRIKILIILWLMPFILLAQTYQVGDLIINANDNTKGVVFWIHPDSSSGWMVALEDASIDSCAWGSTGVDIPELSNIHGHDNVNRVDNYLAALEDTAGYNNTLKIRVFQEGNASFAAGKVDFANGWYLPSAGQLRNVYAALPFIEPMIIANGGTSLAYDLYWTSSEYSAAEAWAVDFGNTYTNGGFIRFTDKNNSYYLCRVRAVRSFTSQSIVYDNTLTYLWNTGSTEPFINIMPEQTTEYSVTVTTEDSASSIAFKTLIVCTADTLDLDDTICYGETYAQNGFNADTTGVYIQTFHGNGCNTTVNLHLTVLPIAEHSIFAEICMGEIYIDNHFNEDETGVYEQRWISPNGCDSVVTLNLTVKPAFSTDEYNTICDYETLQWQDTLLSDLEAGQYHVYDTATAQNGCDSVLVLNLTVLPSPVEQPISGSGKYCEGSNGKAIILENSEVAVTYQLFRDNILITTWIGDGNSHAFGTFTEVGTYTIKASSADGCVYDFEYEIRIGTTPQPPERIIRWD